MIWERAPTPPSSDRSLDVVESARPSLLDQGLAWGAMAPLIAGASAAWLTRGDFRAAAMSLVIIWGGAILAFLAGVRRGLSFRTPGGPQAAQIIVMLWTFVLAIGSMIALRPLTSLSLLIVGFASLGLIARVSAARVQTPLAFASIRPAQMAVATLCLAAVALRLLTER